MLPNRETVLQISRKALAHNYAFLRSKLKGETRLLAVVKAYAYGSDAVAIAKELELLGADYLAVAFTDEGIYLRKHGIKLPILVFHPQPSGLEEIIRFNLEPSLYSRNILDSFSEIVVRLRKQAYPVHLKFNTGLNRLGFGKQDINWLKTIFTAENQMHPVSVYSHLAASDDPEERDFTLNQIESFKSHIASMSSWMPGKPYYHILNTSGIINYPEAQFDMVRSGIGLHGYSNDPETDLLLQPVAQLKTRISQINAIAPGEWVGYNKGFIAEYPMKIATLPLGHADGIGRQFGNGKGRFLIQGQTAPSVGNICMDMTMIDVSSISCQEGDEVTFFGPDFSAEEQACKAGTISYELLTGISQRVTREIL